MAPSTSSSRSRVTPDEEYDSGDLHLVTFDKVLIKVPFIYMQAHSKVFNDIPGVQHRSADSDDPVNVELTDYFETAAVLKLLLDFMTGRTGSMRPYSHGDMKVYIEAFLFLRKWDMGQMHTVMDLFLKDVLSEETRFAYTIFIIGANDDNLSLCVRAVKLHRGISWNKADPKRLLGPKKGPAMDPSSWSLKRAIYCPTPYSWALKRAMDVEKTPDRQAAHFKSLMEAHRAKQSFKSNAAKDHTIDTDSPSLSESE